MRILGAIALAVVMLCSCEDSEPTPYDKADCMMGHEVQVQALISDGTPRDFLLTWEVSGEPWETHMMMWEVAALMTSTNADYRRLGRAIWDITDGKGKPK